MARRRSIPKAVEYLYEFNTANPRLARRSQAAPRRCWGWPGSPGDGSYAYFVAEEVLAPPPQPGEKDRRQAGSPNLYEWHEGATPAITFVATFAPTPGETDPPTGANWTGYAEFDLKGSEEGYKDSRVSVRRH